jgi:hypothetical protein
LLLVGCGAFLTQHPQRWLSDCGFGDVLTQQLRRATFDEGGDCAFVWQHVERCICWVQQHGMRAGVAGFTASAIMQAKLTNVLTFHMFVD